MVRTTFRVASCTGLVILLPLVAGGCARQDQYDHTVAANRSLQEQLAAMEDERKAAEQRLAATQETLDQTRSSHDQLQSQYQQLSTSVGSLDAANRDYMQRIAQLEIGPLPVEVENAIADLARMHPHLLSFDANMGLVRFASDFTFDLGSIDLKPDATSTLTQLATILNEPAARNLEARIIGHTDNVPISRPETRRKHPTNTHLSVHRAISVQSALTQAGVNPDRIQVAGYGEHRPIVPNGAGGAPENRRVEIFLAPMATEAVQATFDAPEVAAPAGRTVEPNK